MNPKRHEVVCIDAHERSVRLIKSPRPESKPIFSSSPTYWCPNCDDITLFRLNWRKPFEPESVEDKFNDAMGQLTPWEEDYCNFYTQCCNTPVRCTYKLKEFAMSSYRYYPNKIFSMEE